MNKNSGTLIIGGLVGLIIRAVIVYLAGLRSAPSRSAAVSKAA